MDHHKRQLVFGAAAMYAGFFCDMSMSQAAAGQRLIFDAHFHLFDPRFPLTRNANYAPPYFTVTDYETKTHVLGVRSGVLVASSFQTDGQAYLIDALRGLGPEWVGVAQLPNDVSDEQITELHVKGVRALRFNVFRGDWLDIEAIVALARRVNAVAGWHVEIYADAAELKKHVGKLSQLPKLVIDHLGMSEAGLPVVLDLVAAGASVKASGFGRVTVNVSKALEQISELNAHALVFGSDLPSTRAKRAFDASDIALVERVLGSQLAQQALWRNGRALYRLPLAYAANSLLQSKEKS